MSVNLVEVSYDGEWMIKASATELARELFEEVVEFFRKNGKNFQRPRNFMLSVISMSDEKVQVRFYEDQKKLGSFNFSVDRVLKDKNKPYCQIKNFLESVTVCISADEDVDVANIYCGVGGVEDIKLFRKI